MTMNWTATNSRGSNIGVDLFFFGKKPSFFCIRILIIIVVNESGDKVISHIIGVRKKTDLQKGVREAKSLGTPDLR